MEIQINKLHINERIPVNYAAACWATDDPDVFTLFEAMLSSNYRMHYSGASLAEAIAAGIDIHRESEADRRGIDTPTAIAQHIIEQAAEGWSKARAIAEILDDAQDTTKDASLGQNIATLTTLLKLAGIRGEKPAFLYPNSTPTKTDTIDPRKETTLNCLIAVLAKKLNYSPDNTDTVGKVYALLEREGVCMDKKTIRANIKAAFSSLNERRE